MRPFALILALALAILPAGPVAAQCRPGSACSARPSFAYAPAPAAPVVWDLADSSGQHWQHVDLGHLQRFVAARDAAAAAPRPIVRPTPPAPPATADPYGFGAWLNRVRAEHHLTPLAYDADLSAIAASNSRLGLGHHGPGGYPMGWPDVTREDVGAGPLAGVEARWLADPTHRAALLVAYASRYGIAEVNGVWTVNFR